MSLTRAPSPATWSPSWLTAAPLSQPRCLPAAAPSPASSPVLRHMRSDSGSCRSYFWLNCVYWVLSCINGWKKVILMNHEAQRFNFTNQSYNLLLKVSFGYIVLKPLLALYSGLCEYLTFPLPPEWVPAEGWRLWPHPDRRWHQPDLWRHHSQYRCHRCPH